LIGEEGEYTVQYTYADQCDYEERIRVIECEGSVIYIPNVFTPNGDGINDFFMAEGERFQVEQFHVFDRYGNKVFETNESFIGWDGTFRGKEVSEGVYTYRLSYFNARGEAEVEFGSITLVR
jgi:gliding motility-associated-like protein